nr:hypothetical protein [Arenimonas daejeonensis]
MDRGLLALLRIPINGDGRIYAEVLVHLERGVVDGTEDPKGVVGDVGTIVGSDLLVTLSAVRSGDLAQGALEPVGEVLVGQVAVVLKRPRRALLVRVDVGVEGLAVGDGPGLAALLIRVDPLAHLHQQLTGRVGRLPDRVDAVPPDSRPDGSSVEVALNKEGLCPRAHTDAEALQVGVEKQLLALLVVRLDERQRVDGRLLELEDVGLGHGLVRQ